MLVRYTAMELDPDKIDDAVLALLMLGASGKRAWKGIDAAALARLHERGFISDPNNRKPTLDFSEQGLARAGDVEGLQSTALARLALIIDQLEEVFTAGPGGSGLPGFLSVLDSLAASGLVWIIATLRGDFLREIDAHRGLAERFDGGARYFLSIPSEPELRQMQL